LSSIYYEGAEKVLCRRRKNMDTHTKNFIPKFYTLKSSTSLITKELEILINPC